MLHHAKVRRIYNDAREVLLTSTAGYDLIVSEPSNPYRSGVASLFTREFYLAGRKRLNEGGLFLQWLQGYEIDNHTVRTILATLRSVYPAVELWQTSDSDLLLIGTQRPIAYPAAALRERLGREPFRSGLFPGGSRISKACWPITWAGRPWWRNISRGKRRSQHR